MGGMCTGTVISCSIIPVLRKPYKGEANLYLNRRKENLGGNRYPDGSDYTSSGLKRRQYHLNI